MSKLFSLFLLSLFSISLCAKDIDLNQLIANTDNKPLFLFLHKPHCGHCARMIANTLKDPTVSKEIANHFVYVDIYIKESGLVRYRDFEGDRRAFAKYMGYDFYPTSIFLDAKGKRVRVTPGARKKACFLKTLTYISSGAYNEMDFESYVNELEFEQDD